MLSEKPSWLHCQFLSLHRILLIFSGAFHLSENFSPLTCEAFLCLDCIATLLAACSVSLTGFSLTTGLLVVRALQSSDLITFSSFIALDKHIYLHAEYAQSFLLSPNCLWKVKDKVVCWFQHPSNHISLSLGTVLPNKTIPLFEKTLVRQAAVDDDETLSLYVRHCSGSDSCHLMLLKIFHWPDFIFLPCFSFHVMSKCFFF